MQAEIQPGGAPRAGEYPAVVDVERRRVDVDVGILLCEQVRVDPVRGGRRPSSTPAAASAKAPEQIDTNRASRASAALIASMSSGDTGSATSRTLGITTVSAAARSSRP